MAAFPDSPHASSNAYTIYSTFEKDTRFPAGEQERERDARVTVTASEDTNARGKVAMEGDIHITSKGEPFFPSLLFVRNDMF